MSQIYGKYIWDVSIFDVYKQTCTCPITLQVTGGVHIAVVKAMIVEKRGKGGGGINCVRKLVTSDV